MSVDIMSVAQKKIDSAIDEKLQQMASAWKSAILAQIPDAVMAGLIEVAYAMPEVEVSVERKPDSKASLLVRAPGLSRESISNDLSYYITGPAKAYAFGG